MGTYKEDLNERWQELQDATDAPEAVEKAVDLAGELGKGAVALAGVGAVTYGGIIVGLEIGIAATASIVAAPIAVPVLAGCVGLGFGTGFFASKSAAEHYFNADTADRRRIENTVAVGPRVYGYVRSARKGLGWLKGS